MKLLLFILLVIVLAACDTPGEMCYTHEKVEYDTAQFKVLNDSIAIRKPTGEVYKKYYKLRRYYRMN